MVTGSKGNTNMMLVMEWVVGFVVVIKVSAILLTSSSFS